MKTMFATLMILGAIVAVSGVASATAGEVIDEAKRPICRGVGINCDEEICHYERTPTGDKKVCEYRECTVWLLERCQAVVGDVTVVQTPILA